MKKHLAVLLAAMLVSLSSFAQQASKIETLKAKIESCKTQDCVNTQIKTYIQESAQKCAGNTNCNAQSGLTTDGTQLASNIEGALASARAGTLKNVETVLSGLSGSATGILGAILVTAAAISSSNGSSGTSGTTGSTGTR